MKKDRQCVTCGTSLDAHAVGSVCAACLLEDGLSGTGPESLDLETGGEVEVFGDYELIKVLAYGGMGIVYQARQKSLDRLVAVKMLFAGPRASEELIQRFHREAEAVAKLSHPNIVSIFEVGEQGGQHFFSMEYVEGRSLSERLRDHPVSIQQAATYVRAISRAIHYAHEQGILHRDLKPSNILIDLNDEIRVTDFGLAKQIGKDSDLTLTGQVLGSPNYFPPEQASGQHVKLGPYSDVYSIGAILYQLLTGRPPFLSDSVQETLVQIRDQDLVSPRLLNPKLPRDLETICLKCLEKEPANRYQSAGDLADELDRFLEGKPIRSRPVSGPVKLMRWTMRRPALAAVWMLLFLGVLTTSWQWRRAEKNALLTQKHLYIADMNLAFAAFEKGNRGRVRDLLERHRPKGNGPDFRDWEWRWLWGQTKNKGHVDLDSHKRIVQSVALTSDGKLAASRSLDGTVYVSDLISGERISTLETGATVGKSHNLVWLDNGRTLAGFDGKRSLRTWKAPDYLPIASEKLPYIPKILALSPDETMIAIAGETGWGLLSWPNLEEKLVIEKRRALASVPYQVCFSPDGRWIAGSDHDRQIVFLRAEDLEERARVDSGFEFRVNVLKYSPDSNYLLSAGKSKIRIWDMRTLQSGQLPSIHFEMNKLSTSWSDGAFSPDGSRLFMSCDDQQIHILDTKTWAEVAVLSGHKSPVTCLDISDDGLHLVSGDRDGLVKYWTIGDLEKLESNGNYDTLQLNHYPVSGKRRFVATIVDGGTRIDLWDGLRLQKVRSVPNSLHLDGYSGEAPPISDDGSMLALLSPSGELSVVDLTSGSILWTTQSYNLDWPAFGFTSDGRFLAQTGMFSGLPLRFFNTSSGKMEFELDIALTKWMPQPEFSSDSSLMAVTSVSQELQVWDLSSRSNIFTIDMFANDIEFSVENDKMYTVSSGNLLSCYAIPQGHLLWSLHPRMNHVRSIALTRDGSRIFLGGNYGQILILDQETLQIVGNLNASKMDEHVYWLCLESGDNALIGRGGTIVRWTVPTWEEIP